MLFSTRELISSCVSLRLSTVRRFVWFRSLGDCKQIFLVHWLIIVQGYLTSDVLMSPIISDTPP